MKVWLIRHAQSLANIGACDRCDCDLSEQGVEQARQAGALLRDAHDLTNAIGIVSPYLRTRRTAMYLSEATGIGFEVHPACREWGRPCHVAGDHYPEEALADVVARLDQFLKSLKPEKDHVIVSHAAPVFVMKHLLAGATRAEALARCVDKFWETVPNCGIHCAG